MAWTSLGVRYIFMIVLGVLASLLFLHALCTLHKHGHSDFARIPQKNRLLDVY